MTSDLKERSLKKGIFFPFIFFFPFVKILHYFYSDRRPWRLLVPRCLQPWVSTHPHTYTHTRTQLYTSLLHLLNREPQLRHRDLYIRYIPLCAFRHRYHHSSSMSIANQGDLECKKSLSLTLSNKATIKFCNSFVFLLFSRANPGRCADCKADFQSLPTPHQSCVITQRRRRRDRVCRRTRGSRGWGAGSADTILAGTSWTRKTL